MSDTDDCPGRAPGSTPLSGLLAGQPVGDQLACRSGVHVAPPTRTEASTSASIAQWAAGFRAVPDGAVLLPHSPGCVGCGPENPHGLGMVVHREGDGVRADLVFDARHLGAPGVAHGGAVAMAFDDLFGFLLYLVGELAVTRNLAVDYLAPVRLGPQYTLRAHHKARIGRRVPVSAELRDPAGALIATASATFIVVEVEHFLRAAGTA